MGSSKFCAIRGGDGFAFVIQRALNDERLGYGGIRNSLAVEFEYSETKTKNLGKMSDSFDRTIATQQCADQCTDKSIPWGNSIFAVHRNTV